MNHDRRVSDLWTAGREGPRLASSANNILVEGLRARCHIASTSSSAKDGPFDSRYRWTVSTCLPLPSLPPSPSISASIFIISLLRSLYLAFVAYKSSIISCSYLDSHGKRSIDCRDTSSSTRGRYQMAPQSDPPNHCYRLRLSGNDPPRSIRLIDQQ